jgi:two-component system response regulator ResD
MTKILVADDEKRIRKIIGDYLRNDGYQVVEAEDGEDALGKFNLHQDISLLILDVMMPNKTGWEVCQKIRKSSNIPIIFLTALGEYNDETYGLDMGADDYIAKPFRYEVLMARVRSAIRRREKNVIDHFRIQDIEIDHVSRVVKKEGERIEMSPKEYELLVYLLKNQGIALERDRILDAVWGCDFFGDKRTVDTHIKNIRAKLGKTGNYIKTIRSFGYMLEVEE